LEAYSDDQIDSLTAKIVDFINSDKAGKLEFRLCSTKNNDHLKKAVETALNAEKVAKEAAEKLAKEAAEKKEKDTKDEAAKKKTTND